MGKGLSGARPQRQPEGTRFYMEPHHSQEKPHCDQHPENESSTQCPICGKHICRVCIASFGYYCSAECLNSSRSAVTSEEQYERLREERSDALAARVGKTLIFLIVLAALGGLGFLGWKFLLDPTGKLVWHQDVGAQSLDIVETGPANVWVQADLELLNIEAAKGAIVNRIDIARAASGGYRTIKAFKDFFIIISNDNRVSRITNNGVEIFSERVSGNIQFFSFDGTIYLFMLIYGGGGTAAELARGLQPRPSLACMSIRDGSILWSKPIKHGLRVEGLTSMRNTMFTVTAKINRRAARQQQLLFALEGNSGRTLWSASLPDEVTWGPEAQAGSLLLALPGFLYAFTPGGEQKWVVNLPEGPDPVLVRDMIFVPAANGGSSLLSHANGRVKWTVKAPIFTESQITPSPKRVVLATAIPKKGAAAASDASSSPSAPGMPGSGELESVLQDLGMSLGGLAGDKSVPTVLCLDRETGKEIWRRQPIYGRLVGNQFRLTVCQDTSESSMLEMMAGGKGLTIIRQLAAHRDGTVMLRVEADVRFGDTVLVGNRLVTVAYERVHQVGAMHMDPLQTAPPPEPKLLGIQAYKLK
jgi:outer membrane protein assembly factor BamB